jgi:hypothetical protein
MLKAPGLIRFDPKFVFAGYFCGVQFTFVTEWIEDIVCQLSFLSPTGVPARLTLSEQKKIHKENRLYLLQKVLDTARL